MGARDVTIGAIFDGARWLKGAIDVARQTPPGSDERMAKLNQLAIATSRARVMADASGGKVSAGIGIALRAAELGIDYLRTPGRTRGRHVRPDPTQAAGRAAQATGGRRTSGE